ncbi:MAG: ABC transporter permease [Prevotellaceae bacterium]|jgi:lipoprotein-releasing system permease protein|nr:ABC transporter permease [Prevotellaceae bacterium]
MNLPIFIARRYLFAKKSQNVINIISGISVVGVILGTMTLVVVLSVFNGFEHLTKSLYKTFDSDLKITVEKGKTFTPDNEVLVQIVRLNGVKHLSQILEENVLLDYAGRQTIAVMKGVDNEYEKMTHIHDAIVDGSFSLYVDDYPRTVLGRELANHLGIGYRSFEPINFYVPRRGEASVSTLNPAENLNMDQIYLSGIFAIEKLFDETYVFVPIKFARELLEYANQITSIEIMADSTASIAKLQKEIGDLMGEGFIIKNRHEQNASLYRMMRSEKMMVYSILVFILLVVSFNITGSLFMLIIEKKKDIITFRNIGANNKLIRRIFLYEGWFISLMGMLIGLILGLLICWFQYEFGLLKLPQGMLLMAYPVIVKFTDILLVVVSVALIGYLAAWIAISTLSKQLTADN